MKKYIGFIGVVMVNCMLITGLLVHAFTLDSVKDSENDNKKECVYIEKTTVKEQEEIERIQENVNKSNKANSSKLNNNYVVKTTTTKSTYNNDSKNYSNDSDKNDNSNNNSNNNENDTDNSNNNYTVEYTNTSYCGFCNKQLSNDDSICNECRQIRSKLGE